MKFLFYLRISNLILFLSSLQQQCIAWISEMKPRKLRACGKDVFLPFTHSFIRSLAHSFASFSLSTNCEASSELLISVLHHKPTMEHVLNGKRIIPIQWNKFFTRTSGRAILNAVNEINWNWTEQRHLEKIVKQAKIALIKNWLNFKKKGLSLNEINSHQTRGKCNNCLRL